MRVLFISGDQAEATTVGERLSNGPGLVRAEPSEAPRRLQAADWDVVVADARFAVPGLLGLARDGGVPVVVALDLAGLEQQGAALLSEGAADLIVRPAYAGLGPMLSRVVRDWHSRRQLKRSSLALLRLAKSDTFDAGSLETRLREILEAASASTDVARVSVWAIERAQGLFRASQKFDARTGRFEAGDARRFSELPAWLRTLEDQQQVAVEDVFTDPRTAEFAQDLRARGITSLLATGVRVGAELKGVLSFEHVGAQRRWTLEEEVLASALAELVALAFERAERHRTEHREDRFQELFQHTRDCILIYRVVPGDGLRVEEVNPALCELMRQPKEALIGKSPHEAVAKETADLLVARHQQVLESRKPIVYEHWLNLPAGRICFHTSLVPFFDQQGAIARLAVIARNVTEERRLELELAQSSKLEALGQLAGNIAHDFNNLLVGVFAWAARLSEHPDPVAREGGQQITQAAMRARELTRQVLTFGKREPLERVPLQVSELVRELVELIAPSLGDQTRLHAELQTEGTEVLADAGQLHQAVLNLTTNALQAMGDHGKLTLKVDSVQVTQEFAAAHPPLRVGAHVRVVVEDTGPGMSPETLTRIFEPFFTTKRTGIGAGLGLSVVHGVVQGHQGALVVNSTVGQGTTFELFLPARALPSPEEAPASNGQTRLMLVDDQLNVVRSSAILLNQLGYQTTVFTDPREALREFAKEPERFDLVMTDFSMPQMSGAELVTAVHAIRPALPVILTSGRAVSEEERTALGVVEVLEKPWRLEEAVQALKRALDPGRASPRAFPS